MKAKNGKPAKKANKLQVERRSAKVRQMILEFRTSKEIIEYMSKYDGLGERQIERYISKIYKELKESATEQIDLIRGKFVSYYTKAMIQADKKKDYRAMAYIADKFANLFDIKSMTQNIEGELKIVFTDKTK